MTRFRAYDSDSDEEENSSHDELDVEVEEASESEISQHSEHEEDDPPDDEEEAEDEEDGDADGEDEEENDENSPPPEPRSDPSITPWAREIGVESQKMHVMQASFFRASEDAAAFHAAAQSSPTRYRPGSRKTLHIPGSVSTAAKHAREPEMDPHHGQPEPVCTSQLSSYDCDELTHCTQSRGYHLRTTRKPNPFAPRESSCAWPTRGAWRRDLKERKSITV